MIVELVENSISNRNNLVEIGQVNTQPADYERYMTLFPYDAVIYTHLDVKKAVAGYKGPVYCPFLFIDIDIDGHPEQALNATGKILTRLFDVHSLDPQDLFIYFSGCKGFHVGIPERVLGGIEPAPNVPQRCKEFVKNLTFGVEGVDLSIYNEQRIFRIVNSRHSKSGLYKIPLNAGELEQGISYILDLATHPRPDFQRDKLISQVTVNDSLKKLWNETKAAQDAPNFFEPAIVGNRNNTLYKQACRLFDRSQLIKPEVTEILKAINHTSGEPVSDQELITIIDSAERNTGTNTSALDLRPFSGWVDDWLDSIRPAQNKLTLVFPAFDKEMRGKLRGKLCVILGKSGVKKSLFAQNIVYQNIFEHQARCIYSTMEMSASQLNSRFIDMHATDANYNGSYLLERYERERPGTAREFIEKHLAPVFSDKLLITQNTGLQVRDYDLMLEKASAQYGPVDILVPDGLSMMGGDGTETELVNKHTKELKQLAIKWNVFIPLIVHVTKEAERDTRDLSSYARGSEKIMDNSDFYVSLSLARNNFAKTDDETFQSDIGYARLVNKRGTGNAVDVTYNFDLKRLLMTEQNNEHC